MSQEDRKLTHDITGPHRHSGDLFRPGIPRQVDRRCGPPSPRAQDCLRRDTDEELTLVTAEDNMNCQLKDITVTARDGRVSHLDQVYIRGSHVRYFIVPDMLRYDD